MSKLTPQDKIWGLLGLCILIGAIALSLGLVGACARVWGIL